MSPVKYVQEVVKNPSVHLVANCGGRFRLPKKVENQLKMGYDPEMDTSLELDPSGLSYYLTIIGILRLMIKLGRINIIMKVSLFSSQLAILREGYLDAAVHVMANVGKKYNSSMVYNPSYPEKDHSVFKKCDWSEICRCYTHEHLRSLR